MGGTLHEDTGSAPKFIFLTYPSPSTAHRLLPFSSLSSLGRRGRRRCARRLAVDRAASAARFSSRSDSGAVGAAVVDGATPTVGAAGVDDATPTGGRWREQTASTSVAQEIVVTMEVVVATAAAVDLSAAPPLSLPHSLASTASASRDGSAEADGGGGEGGGNGRRRGRSGCARRTEAADRVVLVGVVLL
uniref:Uncharacterized protein n=1 Tax=Oryza meridionalis TaxID=40149 RepID=A0A0E0DCI7_9ORYZ